MLARRIEHTLLRATATADEVARLCDEAIEHGFVAVCVAGTWVRFAAQRLAPSPVRTCTVLGFPLGATPTGVKVFEARTALDDGADELDMVLAIGRFRGGERSATQADVRAVVEAAGEVPVKVILETGHLTPDEIVAACELARDAGAAFVKTSTGFGPRGASVDDVRIMRRAGGDALRIKASGGIRTREQAEALVEAGADRLGTSAGPSLVGA